MDDNRYGFVYIWYDRKRKMFYIGSHWGTEDDGYICSSNRMRKAYRRRPTDFSRKIIEKTELREELLDIENKWLRKAEQKKQKYYNLCFTTSNNLWWHNEESRLSVGEKISRKNKANPDFGNWNLGTTLCEETRKKISESTSASMIEYYKKNPRTEETRKKISQNSKRLQKQRKIGMHGKTHTEETKKKMRDNNAMNNPVYVQRVKEAKQGIQYLNRNGKRKMAKPNTDKWNMLIAEGWKVGYN